MFDTIAGLPVHPLVVHAAVVLGPLAALLLLFYAFKPGWRAGLRWPTVLTGGASALSAAVAGQSGESLDHRMRQVATPAARALIEDHVEAGNLATVGLYVLFGAILVVVFFLIKPVATEGAAKALASVGLLVSLLAVAFSTFTVVSAGHTGASASWEEVIKTTTGGGE